MMETTVLMRLEDLRQNLEIFKFIGNRFEESGLCSIDTMKMLKQQYEMAETEHGMFK
jgi:hypothetical protein